MSSLVNKVKEALHSDKSSEPEGTHGYHNTRAANAADPRIDSDRDHRAAQNLSGTTQTGSGNYATGGVGHGTDSRPFGTTDGPATKTDGPHNSNLLNKADPRIDSDRDHSRNMGANPHGTSGTGAYNASENTRTGGLGGSNIGTHESSALGGSNIGTHESSALGGSNMGTHGSTRTGAIGGNNFSENTRSGALGGNTMGTHESSALGGNNLRSENTAGYSSGIPEGTVGPHSSRVANAADPRVDSDMDNSRNMGAHSGTHTGTHTGSGAFGSSTTTHGTSAHTGGLGSSTATHGTSAHTGGLGTSTHAQDNLNKTSGAYGSGPAPNTVGPHKSDMLNKIDPRVDSNLDGSKTYGGDKTFERSNNTSTHAHAHRDPTDAAQVPPSVMQQHIGKPTVAHDDHSHDRARRHSVSHQEDHRGL